MKTFLILLSASMLALPAAASSLRYGAAAEATVPLFTRSGMRDMPVRLQEVTFTESGGGRTFVNTLVSAYDEPTRQYWWAVVRGLQGHPARVEAVRDVTLPSWRFVLGEDSLVAFTFTHPLLHVRELSMRFASQADGDALVKTTHLDHALSSYHPVTVNAAREWTGVNVVKALGTSFRVEDPKNPSRTAVSLIDVAPENGKWYVTLKNSECKRRVITLNAAFALENER
jgi:hypothetical protein